MLASPKRPKMTRKPGFYKKGNKKVTGRVKIKVFLAFSSNYYLTFTMVPRKLVYLFSQ
jgi:hypothetical protein